ncbi:hypothetical protein Tco_0340772 [Tanacetum coccineum]
MHNNIMAVGSRDHPPMLATGRYAQWQSRFLRYIDTRPNGDALRKCILQGPYTPSTVTIPAIHATDESLEIAIERLQQGESLNIQDVKTNLFWEFGKFTSRDAETMESYYSRFYNMMNEMIRNNLTISTMQIQSQIRTERIAKNANPLALVAAASPYPDPYYQAQKSHKSYAPPTTQSSSTRSHVTTRHKGKEIVKPITPPSESASEEDNDLEHAQKDKEMQKNLALIAKYFKNLYKPTNNNLLTSSNSKNKNLDTSPRYVKDNQTSQFGNQRTVTVVGARETIADKDEEIDEQELEAHYSSMEKIQEVPTADSGTYIEPLEHVDSNVIPDSLDMCDIDIQTDQNAKDEYVALANLINSGESNSIQDSCLIALQNKQTEHETYKTLNGRTVDYEKLEIVKEKHDELVKQCFLTKSHYEGLVKEKTKVITDLKHKEEKDIDKMISMEKQLKVLNEIVYKRNQSIKTIHMLAPKGPTFNGRPTFANPIYLKKTQSEKPCLYEIPYDTSDPANRFVPDREETLTLEKESRSK